MKDVDGKFAIYRIGIFGTAVIVDDGGLWNRTVSTYLTFSVDESGTAMTTLQLNIDQIFTYDEQKTFEVFHNGRKNGFKNSEVIDYVCKVLSKFIVEGKVNLD